MPTYAYRAATSTGRIERGTWQASHETELSTALAATGLMLIEAKPRTKNSMRFAMPRVSLAARVTLFSQLADLLAANVRLPDALHSLGESEPDASLRLALMQVLNELMAGATLHEALSRVAGLIDPVHAAIIRASECSGTLTAALRQITAQLQWQLETSQLLRRALRYPLFLLCVTLGVTTFMLLAVVPQVALLLQSLSSELPWLTQLLLLTAAWFAAWWWVLPLLAGLMAGGILVLRRGSAAGRLWLDHQALSLPLFGNLLRDIAVARYAKNLCALLASNLHLPEAMAIAADILGNAALHKLAQQARQDILSGSSLTEALRPLWTARFSQILAIGEHSSALPPALETISQQLAERARTRINTMIGMLEPTLTIMVGGLLAWVVLAVLGPVYGSLAILGRGQ